VQTRANAPTLFLNRFCNGPPTQYEVLTLIRFDLNALDYDEHG